MTRFHNRPPDTRTEVRYQGLRRALRPACSRAPAYAGANALSASAEADARRAQRAPGRDFSPDLTGGNLYYPTKYLKFTSPSLGQGSARISRAHSSLAHPFTKISFWIIVNSRACDIINL
jgi:hypothetical protein